MSLPSFIEKYIDNKENIKNIDIGNNKGLTDYIDFLDIDNIEKYCDHDNLKMISLFDRKNNILNFRYDPVNDNKKNIFGKH